MEANNSESQRSLATLQAATPVGLDFPDSAGWWVHDDNGKDRFVANFTLFELLEDKVRYRWGSCNAFTNVYSRSKFKITYPGKWTRLHMPWDATPVADAEGVGQSEWEPIGNGDYKADSRAATFTIDGEWLTARELALDGNVYHATIKLPSKVRLCTRTTTTREGTGDGS